jgi:hypothetical protein
MAAEALQPPPLFCAPTIATTFFNAIDHERRLGLIHRPSGVPPLPTCCCIAANRRSGPIAVMVKSCSD